MAKKVLPVKNIKPQQSDDHLGQEIQIRCQGADVLELDQMTDFQGKLKTLSEEGYQRLKHLILSLGFSFPAMVWKYRNKNLVIDAHQRNLALRRMRQEGYIIPPLPVVWIEAKDQQEAARKVLAATSQFGEIQVDGLHTFMKEFKIEMPDVESSFKFPEVDFESFRLTYFHVPAPPVVIGETIPAAQTAAPPKTILRPANSPHSPATIEVSNQPTNAEQEWKGMPEFVQEDKGPFRSLIIHFFDQKGVDEFAALIKQKITDKTRMTWYPEMVIEKAADKRYGNHES